MLRITQATEADDTVVRLEGTLKDEWVPEVRAAVERTGRAPSAIALDLADVRFVDRRGEALLRDLIARGATVRRCSTFVAELLKGGRR